MRIAIGGFQHETNTFAPTKATYDDFAGPQAWPGLIRDFTMLDKDGVGEINIPIAGFIKAARAQGHTLLPLGWTAASPSAHVAQEAYERITDILLEELKRQIPLDAVYLDLHGAMVAEHLDDGEGELLSRVREIVGEAVPVVASLDLHANVTRQMFDQADALVAFRTYPHVDMAETGERAFMLLERVVRLGRPPDKAFRQMPYLIPLSWQSTDMEPARTLYAQLAPAEADPVWSVSLSTGFPAADIEECGPAIFAYGSAAGATQRAVDAISDRFIAAEPAFAGRLYTPDEAVVHAACLADEACGPVLIADTQDNPGAGGNSDTTGLLKALVDNRIEAAVLGLLVDPEAALAAHQAGVGAVLDIALGGRSGIKDDAPFRGKFVVEYLSDGKVQATGPYFRGMELRLGLSACLRIGGIRVAVASAKVQMADRELFRCVGIVPEEQKVIVVKSSAHFRADFSPMCKAIIVCVAPGPMVADPARLPWKNLREGMRLSPLGMPFSRLRSGEG